VIAHHLALGGAEHAYGVVVSQVYLLGEGQFGDISQRFNVAGLDACFLEPLAVEGGVVVDIAYNGFEPVLLQGMQVLKGHTLNMRIPVAGH